MNLTRHPEITPQTAATPTERILGYLGRHPNAVDTVAGITRFWNAGCDDRADVELVVAALTESGLLSRRLKPDGEWIYGLAGSEGEAS